MRYPPGLCSYGLPSLLLVLASPAHAQDSAEKTKPDNEQQSITVTGKRGVVESAHPSLLELSEGEIGTYGVGSLAELVEALGHAAVSGRGRGEEPLILVNGRRISNFREVAGYPPESLQMLQILPEEVALRYGQEPDRRVINFVLKEKFSSREVELKYAQPIKGGYSTKGVELGWLRILGENRLNASLELSDTTALTEAERGIILSDPSLPSDPESARYRTLVDDSTEWNAKVSWRRGLGQEKDGGGLTLTGEVGRAESTGLQGLRADMLIAPILSSSASAVDEDGPLESVSQSDKYALNATLDLPLHGWDLTGTVEAAYSDEWNRTDLGSDPGVPPSPASTATFEETTSQSYDASAVVTLSGIVAALPAGKVRSTFNLGYQWQRITSEDRFDPSVRTDLRRGDLAGGVSLSIPLTSRSSNTLPAFGDLTLTTKGGFKHLSDFGTLLDWNSGLTWRATSSLTMQASYIAKEAAPRLSDLGASNITRPNVPIFDFTTGETRLVDIVAGGNPLLAAEKRRDIKISANWQLPSVLGTSVQLEYLRNRSEDVTARFPLFTPQIEAAFPERVTRAPDGRLVALDSRPLTFARQESSRIRYELSFSGRLGAAEEAEGTDPEERQSGETGNRGGGRGKGGGGEGGGGEGGGGEGGGGGPEEEGPDGEERGGGPPDHALVASARGSRRDSERWRLSVEHSIELHNHLVLAPGGPVLNLLAGDGISDGGVSRHTVTMKGIVFYAGVGSHIDVEYAGPTRVTGGDLPDRTDLRFGSLTTVNWRIFSNLGQIFPRARWLKNSRVSFKVENVFNQHRTVTDPEGDTPLRFQPSFVDPVGRLFEIKFRKLF